MIFVWIIAGLNMVVGIFLLVVGVVGFRDNTPFAGVYVAGSLASFTIVAVLVALVEIADCLEKIRKSSAAAKVSVAEKRVWDEDENAALSYLEDSKDPVPVPVNPIPVAIPTPRVQGMDSPKLAVEMKANANRTSGRQKR